jgi:hypothetical protein
MAFNIYKWRREQLITENEEKSTVITKKIKDLTWDDVEGLALPTKSAGVLAAMKTTNNLDSWKKDWNSDEIEMNITIDRTATPWFNQVKIVNDDYSEKMSAKDKAVQADYEKSKYKGD